MKPFLRVLAASTAVLALAACGSGSPSGGSEDTGAAADGGELTPVTVGVIPIVDVAPIYLGVQEGFFEEEGLELELQPAQGGAAIVPAVMSGSMDFGFSNISSMLLANSKGLDVQVVTAGAASTGEDGADFGGILTTPASGVTTAADLSGKKVAVNTLNNINDTTVRASVREAGGDPTTIEFVELAFPDMQAALERGQVDAIQVVEPFLTGGMNSGSTLVASNYVDTADDLTIGAYFTTGAVADSDPELVKKFTNAMNKSLDYAQENPDAVRDVLLTYTKIDAATAEALILPSFVTEINRSGVETLAELSLSDGLITEDPQLDELLP